MKKLIFSGTFVLVFVFTVVFSHAALLMNTEVGWTYNLIRTDNEGISWENSLSIVGKVDINGKTYFHGKQYNYKGDGKTVDRYFHSTETEIRMTSDEKTEYIPFRIGSSVPSSGFWEAFGDQYFRLIGTENINIPYSRTTPLNAYKFQVTKKVKPDGTPNWDLQEYTWFEYVVPDLGVVMEVDYWTTNPPKINRLVSITKPSSTPAPGPGTILLLLEE